MEKWKIEFCEQEHGLNTFPPHRQLSAADCSAIQRELALAVGLSETDCALTVLEELRARSEIVPGVIATDERFDLGTLFLRLGLAIPESLYLNWHRLNDIDDMKTQDVVAVFDSIWYPSSEDLDIIDPEFRWLMMIWHFELIGLVILPQDSSR